uniref:GTP-binding protein Rheb n=1 Tax=Caligus clemensi TaxID=344056 RepID=C1C1B0_CALCM|nr:GTP-binding protein Rheb precursor [Caligus clemensi]
MGPPKSRKIALMGAVSVGKSSLAIQFVQGQFVDGYEPTIENTFTKTVKINRQEYEICLVDTAGQNEYSIFPLEYSTGIDGYVLVYSIDSPKSLEVCQIIQEKLLEITGNPKVPIVLVGNKNDLHMERNITVEEGKRRADEMKAVFLETSAKENQCVIDIFHKVISEIEKQDGNLPEEDKKCCIS